VRGSSIAVVKGESRTIRLRSALETSTVLCYEWEKISKGSFYYAGLHKENKQADIMVCCRSKRDAYENEYVTLTGEV
jgi:hypothetical protein